MQRTMKSTVVSNAPRVCDRAPRRTAVVVCHTKGRNDQGQSTVELALLLPFLMLLLIGAIEFGIVAFAAIEVSNAAEAGAMYGAQNRATAADVAGITLAAQNDASNIVTVNVPTVQQWCTCQSGPAVSISGATNCTPPNVYNASSCVSPSRVVVWVKVDTSATIDPSFHYPGIPNTFTLNGHAVMRVGQ